LCLVSTAQANANKPPVVLPPFLFIFSTPTQLQHIAFLFLWFNFFLMAKQKIKELQANPSAKKIKKTVGSYLT